MPPVGMAWPTKLIIIIHLPGLGAASTANQPANEETSKGSSRHRSIVHVSIFRLYHKSSSLYQQHKFGS